MDPPLPLEATGEGVQVHVKVVPGASRTRVAGVLGDRLKVTVSAPPQGGRANRAVCELIAKVLGVAERDVQVTAGHGTAQKTVGVSGASLCQATEALRRHLSGNA